MIVTYPERSEQQNAHPSMTPAVRRAMNDALVIRGALAGLTDTHIRVINDALIGSPVRVRSLHVHGKQRDAVGTFEGVRKVWCFGATQMSVTVGGSFSDNRGSSDSVAELLDRPVVHTGHLGRVIGIGAVASFEVLGPPRLRCSACGGWAKSGALLDLGPNWSSPEPGETPINSHLVCRKIDAMGDCA